MTTFLLIRHGHTDWVGHALAGHLPGIGLSETGRQQASQLVSRLSRFHIDAVYSSPLQRTLESAEPLAQVRQLPVVPRQGLIEIDFGAWTGKKLAELADDALWKQFNTLRSITRAPGGDLMLDVQRRMTDELQAITAEHPEGTVAVFSHQDTIKAALLHYLGMPLDHFLRIQIDPVSVSVLQIAAWGVRVLSLNSTAG
jgi:probable phosphomutase (TIGR03848 family)